MLFCRTFAVLLLAPSERQECQHEGGRRDGGHGFRARFLAHREEGRGVHGRDGREQCVRRVAAHRLADLVCDTRHPHDSDPQDLFLTSDHFEKYV
jgi:hypothetical protein